MLFLVYAPELGSLASKGPPLPGPKSEKHSSNANAGVLGIPLNKLEPDGPAGTNNKLSWVYPISATVEGKKKWRLVNYS